MSSSSPDTRLVGELGLHRSVVEQAPLLAESVDQRFVTWLPGDEATEVLLDELVAKPLGVVEPA